MEDPYNYSTMTRLSTFKQKDRFVFVVLGKSTNQWPQECVILEAGEASGTLADRTVVF